MWDFYQQVFGEALAEYNAKQKRADREIPDYYEHVKKSGKGKLFYEVVVQFGDLHDCGLDTENWETAKKLLPDYALRTAQAIASHYKPDEKAPTIREKIKLDIDRLVYRTETLDDLLHRLQERGYEVKYGKYISVKHSSAERVMRLKNLGDEYLPKNLEIRIAEKDMFTDRVRYEVQNASPIEKRFHITILNITTAVKQFLLEPKKTDRRRYYFFQNDARINYLSEQLATIGEFGLTSRDSIFAKAQELQRTIHELRSHGDNSAPEEAKLKRVNELIKAYEEIVEGNYIDNLIKAQQEEKQAVKPNSTTQKHTHKR